VKAQPAIGDTVHYTQPRTNWCQAAIVTRVREDSVDLRVFPFDRDTHAAIHVRWAAQPAGVDGWHWPERDH
jgi:hypothetical protein